jgi:hypothetical protein
MDLSKYGDNPSVNCHVTVNYNKNPEKIKKFNLQGQGHK